MCKNVYVTVMFSCAPFECRCTYHWKYSSYSRRSLIRFYIRSYIVHYTVFIWAVTHFQVAEKGVIGTFIVQVTTAFLATGSATSGFSGYECHSSQLELRSNMSHSFNHYRELHLFLVWMSLNCNVSIGWHMRRQLSFAVSRVFPVFSQSSLPPVKQKCPTKC